MAFQSPKNESSTLSEINIIPLVDVMLVLLIIFMVTAPFMQESIDVDIPEVSASAADNEPKDNKVLTLNKAGEIFVAGEKDTPYTLDTVAPKLKSLFPNDAEPEKTIYLRADKTVPYGSVVQLMSLCKSLGISRIGMITEPDQAGGS